MRPPTDTEQGLVGAPDRVGNSTSAAATVGIGVGAGVDAAGAAAGHKNVQNKGRVLEHGREGDVLPRGQEVVANGAPGSAGAEERGGVVSEIGVPSGGMLAEATRRPAPQEDVARREKERKDVSGVTLDEMRLDLPRDGESSAEGAPGTAKAVVGGNRVGDTGSGVAPVAACGSDGPGDGSGATGVADRLNEEEDPLSEVEESNTDGSWRVSMDSHNILDRGKIDTVFDDVYNEVGVFL